LSLQQHLKVEKEKSIQQCKVRDYNLNYLGNHFSTLIKNKSFYRPVPFAIVKSCTNLLTKKGYLQAQIGM
jgi:hypothetical protein